jgi:hypothetical protein
MTVSARSYLAAGLAAVTLSAVAVVPMASPRPELVIMGSLDLTATVSPLIQPLAPAGAAVVTGPTAAATGSPGDTIINAYNFLEPWVAYGFELADWALGFVPGVWWVSPAVDLAYFTAEPIVQSLVYSFAFLIDGQPELIGPTLQTGVNEAATNFVIYSFYWFTSLVPLPPVPPFPVFPVASVAPAAASVVSRAARVASSATAELETATDVGIEAADAGSTEQPDAAVTTAAEAGTIAAEAGTIAAEAGTIAAEALTARPAPGRSSRAQRTAAKVAPPKTVTAQTRIDTPASAAETADTSVAKPVKAPGRAARDAARAARSGMDG